MADVTNDLNVKHSSSVNGRRSIGSGVVSSARLATFLNFATGTGHDLLAARLTGSVGGVADTTGGSAGAVGGLDAAGRLSLGSKGVFGLKDLGLALSAAGAGSVITSSTRNVRLESGTSLLLVSSTRQQAKGAECTDEVESLPEPSALRRTAEASAMGYTPQSIEQLGALAAYVSIRRGAVLQAWRTAVDSDPQLTTASTISRAQFNDHIPEVLDAFERQLRAHNPTEQAQARAEEKEGAAGHGLHRWQQGYDQRETMCEWGHLQLCLLEELEHYSAQHAHLDPSVMPIARRALARLCSDGVCASVASYAHLQQSEAASRLRDLESALAQLTSLEQQRAEAWREAAHDLRGSANVIASASAVLMRDTVPASKRMQFSEILQRGVASLNKLLTDLMDHARLEAGQERRHVADFDAAWVLKEFCDTVRPLAIERNLFLKCEGPSALPVQGDLVKVQRIAQNLVLNALEATQSGGIKVTWGECGSLNRPQWMLYVQDTGPGFKDAAATPLARVLKQATTEAREVLEQTAPQDSASAQTKAAPTLRSQSGGRPGLFPSGEGIGLSIVKRLCELLDASLELETAPSKGTTFRVIFPRHYPDT